MALNAFCSGVNVKSYIRVVSVEKLRGEKSNAQDQEGAPSCSHS